MTLAQAQSFLRNINSKDKVALLFHDDLDGFASGILLWDYLTQEKNCRNIRTFPFDLVRFERDFAEIKGNLENKTKVIIADLAPNVICDTLKDLSRTTNILYIDHHQKKSPVPKQIVEYRTASEYPCSRTIYKLIGGREWLAVAGVLSDAGDKYKENSEFIRSFLEKNKISLEDYKRRVADNISNCLIYFSNGKNYGDVFNLIRDVKDWENLGKIPGYAKKVEIEVDRFTGDFERSHENINGINFYFFKPRFDILQIVVNNISYQNPEEVYVFASPHEDKIRLSARNQTRKVNMIKLLETGITGLKDAGCGGHMPAAGGSINKKDLATFKENLKRFKFKH